MRTDTRSVTIAPGNAAQLDAWDGSEDAFWADHAERVDETIARHHRHFLAAMDLRQCAGARRRLRYRAVHV